MPSVVVDLLILVAVVLFAWLGWSEGLLRALWGFSGLMLGAAAGIAAVPLVLGLAGLSVWVSLAALLVVGLCAVVGRELAIRANRRARDRIGWTPKAAVDRPAGALFGAAATLTVSWMLGLALAGSTLPLLAPAANQSTVLRALDAVDLPVRDLLLDRFTALGRRADFPRYVDALTAERIVAVPAPDPADADLPAVVAATSSVVKVVASGDGATGEQGTAFAVAPDLLMTAAHVVVDAGSVVVRAPDGPVEVEVAACDLAHDVAVLRLADTDSLSGAPLELVDVAAGDPVVVVGFPGDGPLVRGAARVREATTWQSSDVRGDGRHEREGYTVRGTVRPGGSGGPLVDLDGRVAGVVVASSRVDDETGYVLDREQVTPALEAARDGEGALAGAC